ncbi:MAG: S-adenosylmethionine decarboxylase [Deltaproteobacteria bacterium]|nr:S-adenosylmethionine decarboxylase [Deltaproteobacteria bacterium]
MRYEWRVLTDAGREWIVDATGATPDALRDLARVQGIVALLISELRLSPVGEPHWHVFPGEAGVTGLVLLAESHVAVHTFPELGLATFNLYCCRPRAPWPWEDRLSQLLGATRVTVREFERGARKEDAE